MDKETGDSSEIELTTLRVSQGSVSSSPPASSPLSVDSPVAVTSLSKKKKMGSTRNNNTSEGVAASSPKAQVRFSNNVNRPLTRGYRIPPT